MKREKPIFSCANDVMAIFHQNMKEAYNKKVANDPVVMKILDELDQETWGRGCVFVDIVDKFENNPKSLALFIDLVDQAVKNAEENDQLSSMVFFILSYFKEELSIYLQELVHEE